MNAPGPPPAGASSEPREPDRRDVDFNAWLHRLRNEVNSMQMATGAALMLLDAGDHELARDNLRRARQASLRCAQLLNARRRQEE